MVISLGPGPAKQIVRVVVSSLGPGCVKWIVRVVFISLGPGNVIWIVSVVVISLGPVPVTLTVGGGHQFGLSPAIMTVSVWCSSVGSQPCHMDCERVVVISLVPALPNRL